jgi:hypothetical protein
MSAEGRASHAAGGQLLKNLIVKKIVHYVCLRQDQSRGNAAITARGQLLLKFNC